MNKEYNKGLTNLEDTQLVRKNWDRYEYAKLRGHLEYVDVAKLNENFYLGGGLQWTKEDREYLEGLGRPVIEINNIFPAVNTAIGLQLQSRVNIAFKPRGGESDEIKAELLSKVIMQICDDIHYPWMETQAYSDGMIQQRGFMDFRIDFSENIQGVIDGQDLDPLDVLPDPDAQGYDPKRWADVTVMRWMTPDDISELYGEDKGKEVNSVSAGSVHESSNEDYDDRNHFGDTGNGVTGEDYTDETGTKRVLVIDRQYKVLALQKVLIFPTGEKKTAEEMDEAQIQEHVAQGAIVTKLMRRRIRWTVTTSDTLLHDDWSPYPTYTIIPYFPYFRRGKTIGMVDNARSPQEFRNKADSQFLHIISTTANSGYLVEEDSLTNMETSDLADEGSKTGLVIEFKKKSTPPAKIVPNPIPQGIDRVIERNDYAIKTITGMSDALQGLNGNEVSGKAIQSKQFMGQAQLGAPLDNLARTRTLVAQKLLELVQGFYTEERIIMITDSRDISNINHTPTVINQETPEGEILNDLTIGEYDVIITDHPTQATWQDSQFQQAMEMREAGITIPDTAVIEMSSLSKKHEIAKMMTENAAPPSDPLNDAKTEHEIAKTEKVKAETVGHRVDTQFSAIQTAGTIAATPATAPLADQLLRSADYKDFDAAPIIPNLPGTEGVVTPEGEVIPDDMPIEGLPPNTNPTTPIPVPEPGSPMEGVHAGIETLRIEGAAQ